MKSPTAQNRVKCLQYIRKHRKEIEGKVIELYFSTALKNRYVLHPSKLKEIAIEDVGQFIHFLHAFDDQKVMENGRNRAAIGLDQSAIVKMGSILRTHALHHSESQASPYLETFITLIDAFENGRIAGYIEQFKNQLLEDQEKLRIALARVEQK